MNPNELPLVDALSAVARVQPDGFGERFEGEYETYVPWISQLIERQLTLDHVKDALQGIGIDWVTAHYRTRHATAAALGEWVQVGVPYAKYMAEIRRELDVYRKSDSPYLRHFSDTFTLRGEPACILLGDGDGTDVDQPLQVTWVIVQALLAQWLAESTEGRDEQGPWEESEWPSVIGDLWRSGSLDRVIKTFSHWAGRDRSMEPSEALGLLRNACRVTSLARQLQPEKVTWPRAVVLAPVAVGENTIGSMAFIGTQRLSDNGARLLAALAASILGPIRLQEEPIRERRIAHIEQLNQARAMFVQSVAHSIRNPLDALLSHIDAAMLALSKIGSNVKELQSAADRVILGFAHEEVEDLIKPNKTSVRVADFIADVAFIHELRYQRKGIKLAVTAPDAEWTARLDKWAMFEVFHNLLSNALRFARSKVTIEVERRERRDRDPAVYRFRVRNDGPEIDAETRAKLLNTPLLSVDAGATPGPDGETGAEPHGVGLYLSRVLVENHGGKIWLSEPDGSGPEFVVQMPEI